MFNLGYILVSFLTFVTFANGQKIPSDIDRCFHSDERCLNNAVQNILRRHSGGHKGLNLISLDPLPITSLNFKKIPGSPVSVDLKLKDATLTGINRGNVIKVSGFKREPIDLDIDLEIEVPKIVLSGLYEIDGQIQLLPISGNGKCTITFEKLIIVAKLKCGANTKDSKKYLDIQTVEMDFKPKRVRYNFENLFDGDKLLEDKMNEFLNENWDLVFSELKPLVDESLAKIVLHIANGPFSKLPYSELFLPL